MTKTTKPTNRKPTTAKNGAATKKAAAPKASAKPKATAAPQAAAPKADVPEGYVKSTKPHLALYHGKIGASGTLSQGEDGRYTGRLNLEKDLEAGSTIYAKPRNNVDTGHIGLVGKGGNGTYANLVGDGENYIDDALYIVGGVRAGEDGDYMIINVKKDLPAGNYGISPSFNTLVNLGIKERPARTKAAATTQATAEVSAE